MLVADFDFSLPADRIAQHPARPRDAARLLVVGDRLQDELVRDLPSLLRPRDVLVVNDTRVLPTRLFGRRGPVKVEVTLIEPLGGTDWRALVKPGRRLRPTDRVEFYDTLAARVIEKRPDGSVQLRFGGDPDTLADTLECCGSAPLPPYIHRRVPDKRDRDDYQTVYAARAGAIAAPTAGLHFTEDLLSALNAAGIARTAVTLHVGAGTFLPVKAERVEDHKMHAECGEIRDDAADAIASARDSGGRIVAVGTTALRVLEQAADQSGRVRPWAGETALFITPGYRFRVVDILVTNFHLPRSTLFMLVCAFAGTARMKAAYAHAIAAGYRFYSYGDACLLHRDQDIER